MIKKAGKILAGLALFGMIAAAAAFLTLNLIVRSTGTVVVPDLVGRDIVDVLEALTALELNTKVRGMEFSPEIPKNSVIFQDPAPGAEIRKGRDIQLVISKGTRTLIMPNLTGLPLQQAGLILEENGLARNLVSTTHTGQAGRDEIIAQSPLPGTVVEHGQGVNLLVSLGKRPAAYAMPNLTGLSLEDAIYLIEDHRLRVGKVATRFFPEEPLNVVAAQEPAAGFRVAEGESVRLVVNRSPDTGPATDIAAPRVGLFHHRLADGFLRRHIRVRVHSAGVANDIFDDFVKGGEDIWLFIPNQEEAMVFLYQDEELIRTERIAPWSSAASSEDP